MWPPEGHRGQADPTPPQSPSFILALAEESSEESSASEVRRPGFNSHCHMLSVMSGRSLGLLGLECLHLQGEDLAMRPPKQHNVSEVLGTERGLLIWQLLLLFLEG